MELRSSIAGCPYKGRRGNLRHLLYGPRLVQYGGYKRHFGATCDRWTVWFEAEGMVALTTVVEEDPGLITGSDMMRSGTSRTRTKMKASQKNFERHRLRLQLQRKLLRKLCMAHACKDKSPDSQQYGVDYDYSVRLSSQHHQQGHW